MFEACLSRKASLRKTQLIGGAEKAKTTTYFEIQYLIKFLSAAQFYPFFLTIYNLAGVCGIIKMFGKCFIRMKGTACIQDRKQ